MPLYKQKGSTIWWVSLSHPDLARVRRSTGTDDRAEAQRLHDEWKAQLHRQPRIKGRTWGQAVMLWASEPGRSESDVLSMAKFGRAYPDRPLSQVTAESLAQALAFCETPSTYMRYRGRLMAILNVAKAQGWLLDVPKLPTKRVATKARQWITQEEWAKLYEKLPKHQKPMAKFAIETGLRQANVLGLTWDRIDMERRVMWIEAEDMKAEKALAVPLSDGAMDVLEACKGQHQQFVFTYAGKPIKEIKTAFQRACVEAGLGAFEPRAGVPQAGPEKGSVPHRTGRSTVRRERALDRKDSDADERFRRDPGARYVGFTWHGLRHTWATWHRLRGTPLDVLQKLGGWSDPRMVQNYAHFSSDYLAGFVK